MVDKQQEGKIKIIDPYVASDLFDYCLESFNTYLIELEGSKEGK
jgi:hypothetical protein